MKSILVISLFAICLSGFADILPDPLTGDGAIAGDTYGGVLPFPGIPVIAGDKDEPLPAFNSAPWPDSNDNYWGGSSYDSDYSYTPTPLLALNKVKVGDQLFVRFGTYLKVETTVLAYLRPGLRLFAYKLHPTGWIHTKVLVNGKEVWGWARVADLTH